MKIKIDFSWYSVCLESMLRWLRCSSLRHQNAKWPESDIIRLLARVRVETLRDTTHQNLINYKSISFCVTAVWSRTRERMQRRFFFSLSLHFPAHILTYRVTDHRTKWLCLISFYVRRFLYYFFSHARILLKSFHSHCYSFAHYLAYHLVHCLWFVWWLFVLSQHVVASSALGTHESHENTHEIYIKLSLI